MTQRPYNVLFLCTENSARSVMAEAILNRLGAGKFVAHSAGSTPKGEVHPETLALLKRLNYEPEATIVATIGLLYVLQQAGLSLFGPDARPGPPPFAFRLVQDEPDDTCGVGRGRLRGVSGGGAPPPCAPLRRRRPRRDRSCAGRAAA